MPLYNQYVLSSIPSIGIIGGVGPLASIVTHQKIIDCFVATRDQDFPNIIHSSFSGIIPDRTQYLLNNIESPIETCVAITTSLCSIGVRVVGVPCNTFHAEKIFVPFVEQVIEAYPKVHIVNMIQKVMDYITGKSIKKVGVLATAGTMSFEIYDFYAKNTNVELLKPDKSKWYEIHNVIYDAKNGIKVNGYKIAEELKQIIFEEAQKLKDRGAEKIILGCTELSIFFSKVEHNFDLIEPNFLLAEAMVDTFLKLPENNHLFLKTKHIDIEITYTSP